MITRDSYTYKLQRYGAALSHTHTVECFHRTQRSYHIPHAMNLPADLAALPRNALVPPVPMGLTCSRSSRDCAFATQWTRAGCVNGAGHQGSQPPSRLGSWAASVVPCSAG